MAKNDNLTDFLTDVANAIREKKGTADPINPQNFSDEIAGIETGGDDSLDKLIEGTLTELVSNATSVVKYLFSDTDIGLTSVSLPKATSIGNYAFYKCTQLESIDLPSVKSLGYMQFYGCTALKNVNIPSVTSLSMSAFRNCTSLTEIDLPSLTSIGQYVFQGCTNLKAVILRSETMCTLNVSTSNQKPFYDLTDVYIYVPKSLQMSYNLNTNWNEYQSKIRILEDYTVDGTITGELDESKI